jgi:pimeloyl-ACP methyl ester carboxylesterase
VVTEGSGDNAVVLLHGLGGDHNQGLGFAPAIGQLEGDGRRWRKVAVDMRGHGDTEALGPPETLNYAAFLEDLTTVLGWLVRQTGRPPVALVGMSMGAELGLQAGLQHPDLVQSLILIRPSGPDAPPGPVRAAYPVIADLLRRFGPDGKAHFARSPEYRAVARRSEATAASLLKQFDRAHAQARVDVLEHIPKSTRISADELEGIITPALVCVSPEDPAHEMRCGRIIAQRLAQALPLVILPQKMTTPGAHEEQVRCVVGAFLAEQAAVPARMNR